MAAQKDSVAPVGSIREELLELALRSQEDAAAFLSAACARIAANAGAEYVGVVRNIDGRWTALAEHGPSAPLPTSLLNDILDSDEPLAGGAWTVSPLERRSNSGELLAVRFAVTSTSPARRPEAILPIAKIL